MLRATSLLLIFCFTITKSVYAQCSPKNKNHLLNASFEEGESSWQIKGQAYSLEVLDGGTEDSNGFLSITDGDVVWIQDVRVPTKALSMCLGGLVKNTLSSPKSGWAVIEYAVLNASGKAILTEQMPHLKPGTHWQKVRKTERLPASAAKIQVRLRAKYRANIPMDHEARFDDLFVRFGR